MSRLTANFTVINFIPNLGN